MTTRNLKKLYDKSVDKKRFLLQVKTSDIERTDPKVLAYIIKNDPDSIYYLPENKIEMVFDLLPKSWFTSDIVNKLNYYQHQQKDFLQKNFYKYFSDLDLYIPLDYQKKPYDQYSTSYYEYADYGRREGWRHNKYPLKNVIIWDRKKFEKYTSLYPVYLSKIRINEKSKITKLTESYLEVNNYNKLVLNEPQEVIRE